MVFTDSAYGIRVQMNNLGTVCKGAILGGDTTDVASAAYVPAETSSHRRRRTMADEREVGVRALWPLLDTRVNSFTTFLATTAQKAQQSVNTPL